MNVLDKVANWIKDFSKSRQGHIDEINKAISELTEEYDNTSDEFDKSMIEHNDMLEKGGDNNTIENNKLLMQTRMTRIDAEYIAGLKELLAEKSKWTEKE